MTTKESVYHQHIQRDKNGKSDVYAVLAAFGVTCPARAHAIKKALFAGQRIGGKSERQDIEEAIWSLQRSLELLPHLVPASPQAPSPVPNPFDVGEVPL